MRNASCRKVCVAALPSSDAAGKPRTATITASQPTELLRLDKEKLDNALGKYPGIRKVLDEFYKKRAKHTVEAMIESLKKRGS